jgi:type III pantothenate kinase
MSYFLNTQVYIPTLLFSFLRACSKAGTVELSAINANPETAPPQYISSQTSNSRFRMSKTWLALTIGNSRLHWGLFSDETLIHTWDSNYVDVNIVQQLAEYQGSGQWGIGNNEKEIEILLATSSYFPIPIALASVVPAQTQIWQSYPSVQIITLENIPIKAMYPTFGIDRALALLGAGSFFGFPIMVIDSGTALTFTSADNNYNLIGGAILPGLGLQLATLTTRTGQLPNVKLPEQLPPRFALNTPEAMQSGVIYTLLAGIKDFLQAWWQDFPDGRVVITGGDRTLIIKYLLKQFPEIAERINVETNLIFWGMREIFRIQDGFTINCLSPLSYR